MQVQTLAAQVAQTRKARLAELKADLELQHTRRPEINVDHWLAVDARCQGERRDWAAKFDSPGQAWQATAHRYMRGLYTMDEVLAVMATLATQVDATFFDEVVRDCPSRSMGERMAKTWAAWQAFVEEMAAH